VVNIAVGTTIGAPVIMEDIINAIDPEIVMAVEVENAVVDPVVGVGSHVRSVHRKPKNTLSARTSSRYDAVIGKTPKVAG